MLKNNQHFSLNLSDLLLLLLLLDQIEEILECKIQNSNSDCFCRFRSYESRFDEVRKRQQPQQLSQPQIRFAPCAQNLQFFDLVHDFTTSILASNILNVNCLFFNFFAVLFHLLHIWHFIWFFKRQQLNWISNKNDFSVSFLSWFSGQEVVHIHPNQQ